MTIEYAAKSLISLPIRLAYAGAEDLTIKMIVYDPQHIAASLDPAIKVVSYKDNSPYTVIEIPRYKEFLRSIKRIAREPALTCIEIAGNREINIKIRYPDHAQKTLEIIMQQHAGCQKQYTWKLPTHVAHTYAVLTIPVNALHVVSDLEKLY